MKHFHRFEHWFNKRFGWFFTNGNKPLPVLLFALALHSCTYERVCGPVDKYFPTPQGMCAIVCTADGEKHDIAINPKYLNAAQDTVLCGFTDVWFWQDTPLIW